MPVTGSTAPAAGDGEPTAGDPCAAVSAAAVRADLLALTPDTLASLANRGLVKRATKELDAGVWPTVSVAADGLVRAVFVDGTETELPSGVGLDPGRCTCAAPGVCRHLLGLVLAYQRAAGSPGKAEVSSDASLGATTAVVPGDPAEPIARVHDATAPPGPVSEPVWSPGRFDDEALLTAVGPRSLAAARRTFARGYAAQVHRGGAEGTVPWVELPTCTVRFPVPGEIGYALTDATATLRGEMLALAVWAFRAADAENAHAASTATENAASTATENAAADGAAPGPARVHVGGTGRPRPTPTSTTALDRAVDAVGDLLLEGVAHSGPLLGGALRQTGKKLTAASLHWPAAVVESLAEQLAAYDARSAGYRAEDFAALAGELYARHRAALADPDARADVLGVREAGETPLRRVRLTSLGCRVSAAGGNEGDVPGTVAEVFFAHPDAGLVLVLRKEWPRPAGKQTANPVARPAGGRSGAPAPGSPLGGPELAARRVAGTTLRALAAGSLVSESARRTAGRALSLARSRVSTTTVVPAGSSWADLPASLLVRDLAGYAVDRDGQPPRLIRPRVEAESVRVVELSRIGPAAYDPAEQRLEVEVFDASGTRALVSATYNPLCPGALDVLAEALREGGPIRYVSGVLSRSQGRIRIDPLAVLTPDGAVSVPDLTPAAPSSLVGDGRVGAYRVDQVTEALDEALGALAEAAHHGLRNPPPSVRSRLEDAAARLARCGLDRAARLVRGFLSALPLGGTAARTAWADAQIRLSVSAELHQERGSGAG